MRSLFICFLLITCIPASAQKLFTAPEPSWIEGQEYNNHVSDSSGISNGYLYLLISAQNNLETKESYRKYAIKVVSEQGLSVASSINESFDPSYQKMLFHSLNIIRAGKKIDKLDPGRFEIIRREDEMDRAVYDKTLSMVYNLPDVRVGDIVEYSFTRKGWNPVFNDHSFGVFYLQYGVPVKKFAHRLLFDKDRPVRYRAFGSLEPPNESASGDIRKVEWIRENVPALLSDDVLPSWYDPYARIEYSDFKSWEEVKAWANTVFKLKESQSSRLKEVVIHISRMDGDAESRIKECIRIVQADIRYLSFSDGIHGYKPHSPDMVYDQKYGDCKDKSLLLTYLLTKIGIESYPALVSTEAGHIMSDVLPTPTAFNHCIVNFKLNDSTYWIDPTSNPQVGALKSYSVPSYQKALVINSPSSALDKIPESGTNSRINVQEEYTMDEVGGYVTLKVETKYHGEEADDMRSYITSNTKEKIHKNFLNFYANDYSEITLKNDVTFEDDQENNIVSSKEEYLLKDFWTVDAEKQKNASIYARVLSSYLSKPDTRLRTMPLALSHPRQVTQTIKIYLPEDWNLDDYNEEIESDGFIYRSSALYSDRVITLRYFYKTKSSFVEASRTAEHIVNVDKVLNDLTLNIYKSDQASSANGGWKTVFLTLLLVIGVGIYVIKKTLK